MICLLPGSTSTPLARKLSSRILAHGPISLHDYIDACLYDNDHGYYRRAHAVGADGDFTTAPEISQVFGELVGLWAGEVWRLMGSPRDIRVIELGPGRGTLMADALRVLKVVPGFYEAAAVHLVETSETLMARQMLLLANAPCPVLWHRRLNDVPSGPAIVIANEFFDCLPVRQFVFDAMVGAWRERMVSLVDGAFAFASSGNVVSPSDLRFFALTNFQVEPDEGDIFEFRPAVGSVLQQLALRQHPIAALIVDYGHEQPGFGDTVQAVENHRFVSIFDAPGEVDITAHVDFASLAQDAKSHCFSAFGPMPMGEWLLKLGLPIRASQLAKKLNAVEQNTLNAQISRLVDPSQMGVLFKVMTLTHGFSADPPPFSRGQNRR